MGDSHLKIHKGVSFAPQATEPANPINGDIYYDDTLNQFRMYKNGAWSVLGSGSVSGIILEDNSSFESTIGDWLAYADAADTVPVDGTGGSATTTVTRTESTPLAGRGSQLITKDAADRQGEGGSLTIDVDPKFRGQPVALSFSYEASAGFDRGDPSDPVGSPSDLAVYFYDVTNAKLLIPDRPGIFGGGLYSSSIQIPSDTESIRVILHIATTNASAWTFKADDFILDLAPNGFFTRANSSEIKFLQANTTAASVLLTDLTFDNLKIGTWYKVSVQAFVRSTNNQPSSAQVQTDHDSVIIMTNGMLFDGNTGGLSSWVRKGNSRVFKATATTLTFTALNSGSGSRVDGTGAGDATFAQLETLNNYKDVEIAAASGLNAKVIFTGNKVGNQAVTANVTDITFVSEKDSIGGWTGSTYVVKSPGDYLIIGTLSDTASNTWTPTIFINGVTINKSLNVTFGQQASGSVIIPDLKYGDIISIRSTGSFTVASGADISIHKIGSEQQPYAPRVAYIKEIQASGVGPGYTPVTGVWTTRQVNTLTGDTGSISLSSNQFTLQPGVYHITASATASANGQNPPANHKIKLRNITDSTNDIIGRSALAQANAASATVSESESYLEDTITITSAKTFEIQHRSGTTGGGFGGAGGYGVNEVYAQIRITKVL